MATFNVGDMVKHAEDSTPRKVLEGPVKEAHCEAYRVEGLSGVIPVHVLSPAETVEESSTP